MKRSITSVWKLMGLMLFAGATLVSCEKNEDGFEEAEVVSAELAEPSFTNYLIISKEDETSCCYG